MCCFGYLVYDAIAISQFLSKLLLDHDCSNAFKLAINYSESALKSLVITITVALAEKFLLLKLPFKELKNLRNLALRKR